MAKHSFPSLVSPFLRGLWSSSDTAATFSFLMGGISSPAFSEALGGRRPPPDWTARHLQAAHLKPEAKAYLAAVPRMSAAFPTSTLSFRQPLATKSLVEPLPGKSDSAGASGREVIHGYSLVVFGSNRAQRSFKGSRPLSVRRAELVVNILLSFISMEGVEKGGFFSMCEIDSALRLAGFMDHQLPEFPFPLTLEGKNKKLNCPLTDQIPIPLYNNTWPGGRKSLSQASLLAQPPLTPAPLWQGFLSMQLGQPRALIGVLPKSTDLPKVNPPPPLFLINQLSLKLGVPMSYPGTCVDEACEL